MSGKDFYITRGVNQMVEKLNAFWLIKYILSCQFIPEVRQEEFQVWILTIEKISQRARFSCEDGNNNEIIWLDLDMKATGSQWNEGIKLYFRNGVIHFPSER